MHYVHLGGAVSLFIMCHSQSATLPVHLFVSSLILSICMFYLTIFNAEYFSRFYLELCENFKDAQVASY